MILRRDDIRINKSSVDATKKPHRRCFFDALVKIKSRSLYHKSRTVSTGCRFHSWAASIKRECVKRVVFGIKQSSPHKRRGHKESEYAKDAAKMHAPMRRKGRIAEITDFRSYRRCPRQLTRPYRRHSSLHGLWRHCRHRNCTDCRSRSGILHQIFRKARREPLR